MSIVQTRRSISVRGDTYRRLHAYLDGGTVSASEFVETRIAEYLDANESPAQPSRRLTARPGQDPPSVAPDRRTKASGNYSATVKGSPPVPLRVAVAAPVRDWPLREARNVPRGMKSDIALADEEHTSRGRLREKRYAEERTKMAGSLDEKVRRVEPADEARRRERGSPVRLATDPPKDARGVCVARAMPSVVTW